MINTALNTLRKTILPIMLLLSFLPCAHAMVLQLGASDAYPYSTPDGKGMADRIVQEALKRSGHEGKILYMPSERSITNANEGVVDGEFLRIAGIESIYSNLVMIPEDICENSFAAFTMDQKVRLSGWKSLKQYDVGYINGWKILETNAANAKSIFRVKDDTALFELLKSGRVDLVLFEGLRGKNFIDKNGINGVRQLQPALATRKMYLYLHKKHVELIPEITSALKSMKRDGTVQMITSEFMKDSR